MKNLFKRREKKDHSKPDLDKKKEVLELAPGHQEQDALELQAHGEFLESDEDLGYC